MRMRWSPRWDVGGGLLVIAAGLLRHDSLLLGDLGVLPLLFDGLGIAFIVRGLVRMIRDKASVAAPPPPPPGG